MLVSIAAAGDTDRPMSRTVYRGRFAPSPTGPLHLGSLLAALGSWLLARHAGGQWLLRIEDIDPPREVPGAAALQVETLHAFGLHPDGEIWFQHDRHAAYAAALQTLLEAGDAFPCPCSRRDLEATGGRHLAPCASAASGRTPAIRLRVPDTDISFVDGLQGPQRQNLRREVGDVVLRRADGYWAYQLAVVVDDAAQGITDVVRGADLLDSTPRQIWLQRRLGLPTPNYLHLPLLLDEAGRKLSKSLAAQPVEAHRPLPALASCWRLLGQDVALPEQGLPPDRWLELALEAFAPDRIPRRLPPSAIGLGMATATNMNRT